MFCQSLMSSTSKEVKLLASIAVSDIRSNMGMNIKNIAEETQLDPLTTGKLLIGKALHSCTVPLEDTWKVPLLARLLKERQLQKDAEIESKDTDDPIDVVCTSSFS